MIESCPSTQSQQQTLPLYRQLQVSSAPFFLNFRFSPLNVLTKKWDRIWILPISGSVVSAYFISILDSLPCFDGKNGLEFCMYFH